MAKTFTRTFRIRQYECDQYGHLNNVNYVRFMQETALDASAAVGYDIDRYQAMGRLWLIRETDIEYLQPLHYNDEALVTTWVADFRRVQSRRMYEIHRGSDGALAARAATNWVYVDAETRQPTRIPDEIIAAYQPALNGAEANPDRFPALPEPPPDVFTLRRHVDWADIDRAGHVNNAAYFSYLQAASVEVGRHYGWAMQRQLAHGFAWILRQMRLMYLQPAHAGDALDIATYLFQPRRSTVHRGYTVRRAGTGELLARARGYWVCFDLEKQRPMRIPAEFGEAFQANLVTDR